MVAFYLGPLAARVNRDRVGRHHAPAEAAPAASRTACRPPAHGRALPAAAQCAFSPERHVTQRDDVDPRNPEAGLHTGPVRLVCWKPLPVAGRGACRDSTGCDSAAPGRHEVGRASGPDSRICDAAYLHGRGHVGLEVNEILLVRRVVQASDDHALNCKFQVSGKCPVLATREK